jgi:hypothetical protein
LTSSQLTFTREHRNRHTEWNAGIGAVVGKELLIPTMSPGHSGIMSLAVPT